MNELLFSRARRSRRAYNERMKIRRGGARLLQQWDIMVLP